MVKPYYFLLSFLINRCACVGDRDELYLGVDEYQDYYDLPKLPYSFDSMEPWIDKQTMEVHYSGHHKSYMAKMNAALTEWRGSVSLSYCCE